MSKEAGIEKPKQSLPHLNSNEILKKLNALVWICRKVLIFALNFYCRKFVIIAVIYCGSRDKAFSLALHSHPNPRAGSLTRPNCISIDDLLPPTPSRFQFSLRPRCRPLSLSIYISLSETSLSLSMILSLLDPRYAEFPYAALWFWNL